MNRVVAVGVLIIALASIFVLGVVSNMRAQTACSDATFNGTYVFRVTGFNQGAPPNVAQTASHPSAAVGIVTADGAGNISATVADSDNGTFFPPATATGTYTVNPDCTGSFTAGGATSFLVVTPNGARASFLFETSGRVESAEAIRGNTQNMPAQTACSLSTFNGTYVVRVTGFFQGVGAPFTTPALHPGASVAIATADGLGNITSATGARSDNGTFFPPGPAPITGFYTVNPDCTGTATIGGATSFLVVTPNGARAFFLNETPGSVESGEAIRGNSQQ